MRTIRNYSLLFLVALSLLFSCRKNLERPSWDVDVVGPIVYSTLGIDDLIADSLIQVNPDSSITLVYSGTIYQMLLDTLVNIPDTMINDSFALPLFVPSINVTPGQQIFTQTDESSFNVDDVELTDAYLLQGECSVTLYSTIDQPVDFTYQLPYASLSGVPFSKVITIPAGSTSNPSQVTRTFDLSGYQLNLRGTNHPYNSYTTKMIIKMSASGAPTVVTNTDKVKVSASFQNLVPRYAKGYFGNRTISSPNESNAFTVFNKIIEGTLDINQVNVELVLTNWIGADARVTINQLQAENTISSNSVSLTNSIIGNAVNINRANDMGSYSQPSNHSITLNNGNSNIDQLLETLPNQSTISFDMEINPLGDVSGHNDFIYNDQTFRADLNVVMPLSLIANNLTLVDTIDIGLKQGDGGYVTSGKFYVDVDNGFPLSGNLQLYFFNSSGVVTDSIVAQGNLLSAYTNLANIVTQKRKSVLEFHLTKTHFDRLYAGDRLLLKVRFNTSSLTQHVTLYSTYKIAMKIRGDFNYLIK